jgi:hypothetical protein
MLTLEQAEEKGLMELLIFDCPEVKMTTQYGYITHLDWLLKEQERILQTEGRVAEIVKESRYHSRRERLLDLYALFVDRRGFIKSR